MCKKEKGNKSGQLETIQCLKFIHIQKEKRKKAKLK